LDIPEGIPMYGLRTKDTHIEVIVKIKTTTADELIFQQKKFNHQGTFLREIIREGTKTDDSTSIIWIKNPEGLKATIAKADSICKEAFVIWRPGKMGVRFPNSQLAKARTLLMPSFLRPSEKALGVKGSISFIIEGLPIDFDPQDVINRLSDKNWHVLLGKPMKKSTCLRVLADAPPADLVIPNGKRPIVIRREFAPVEITVEDEEESDMEADEEDETKEVGSSAHPAVNCSAGSGGAEPVFSPGWNQSSAQPAAGISASLQVPSSSVAPAAAAGSSAGQKVAKSSSKSAPSHDKDRIDKLEAAIAAIQSRQDSHDHQLQLNSEQVSALGSSVDQLRGDNSTLMTMMQAMMQKQDDLLTQQRQLAGEDRRVRPRSALGDCPTGLE
jgi:hypothetical protein